MDITLECPHLSLIDDPSQQEIIFELRASKLLFVRVIDGSGNTVDERCVYTVTVDDFDTFGRGLVGTWRREQGSAKVSTMPRFESLPGASCGGHFSGPSDENLL